MDQRPDHALETARRLSGESRTGLLFCYKALKKFDWDDQRALAYLKSDQFKHSLCRK